MSNTEPAVQPVDPKYQLFEDLLALSKNRQMPTEGEVIDGIVVAINKGEALIDYGGKAEGIVQGRELVDGSLEDPIQVGATILAVVMQPEDEEGRAVLSIRRARAERKWREMNDKFESKQPVRISVVQPNKGGLIVNAEGLQGFVPISQLGPLHYPSKIQKGPGFADAAIAYLTQFTGEEFDTQIIEYERETNRLILSERVLLQRTGGFEPLEELDFKVDNEVDGKVVAIKDFGVFVDLGTASGLVHISEMSWDRVNHPGDLVKMGQDVRVKVIGIDEGGRRVSLSMKRLSLNPWVKIAKKYELGQVVKGVVTKIVDYGAFVQLQTGFDGLVHISELSTQHVNDPADVLQEGQEGEFKIILLDHDNQRLGLSYRQVTDPDVPRVKGHEAEARKENAVDDVADAASPVEVSSPVEEAPTVAKKINKKVIEKVVEVAAVVPAVVAEPVVDREAAIAELSTLPSIGAEKAASLVSAGFPSIERLAKASVAEISLIPGFRMASAEKVVLAAAEMLAKNETS